MLSKSLAVCAIVCDRLPATVQHLRARAAAAPTPPAISTIVPAPQPDARPAACRCPGRYFAEAELALIASLLLLLFDWRLLPCGEAAEHASSKAQQRTAGSAGTAGGTAGAAAGAAAAEAANSIAPGDPAGLLPPPDLRKLVGIKVPAGPCWVQYQRRQLAGC